jgi:hypothetical protein
MIMNIMRLKILTGDAPSELRIGAFKRGVQIFRVETREA